MTDVLCYADSYLREFDATVVETTPRGVVLDRTAFLSGRRRSTETIQASYARVRTPGALKSCLVTAPGLSMNWRAWICRRAQESEA